MGHESLSLSLSLSIYIYIYTSVNLRISILRVRWPRVKLCRVTLKLKQFSWRVLSNLLSNVHSGFKCSRAKTAPVFLECTRVRVSSSCHRSSQALSSFLERLQVVSSFILFSPCFAAPKWLLSAPVQCFRAPKWLRSTPVQCFRTPKWLLSAPVRCFRTPKWLLSTPARCFRAPKWLPSTPAQRFIEFSRVFSSPAAAS